MKTVAMRPDDFLPEFYETNDKLGDFETGPHPYGFYHYPNNIQDKTAFGRLKKVMIEDKENRIEMLKTEIQKLKGVKYEDGTD